eukprot:g80806.t1
MSLEELPAAASSPHKTAKKRFPFFFGKPSEAQAGASNTSTPLVGARRLPVSLLAPAAPSEKAGRDRAASSSGSVVLEYQVRCSDDGVLRARTQYAVLQLRFEAEHSFVCLRTTRSGGKMAGAFQLLKFAVQQVELTVLPVGAKRQARLLLRGVDATHGRRHKRTLLLDYPLFLVAVCCVRPQADLALRLCCCVVSSHRQTLLLHDPCLAVVWCAVTSRPCSSRLLLCGVCRHKHALLFDDHAGLGCCFVLCSRNIPCPFDDPLDCERFSINPNFLAAVYCAVTSTPCSSMTPCVAAVWHKHTLLFADPLDCERFVDVVSPLCACSFTRGLEEELDTEVLVLSLAASESCLSSPELRAEAEASPVKFPAGSAAVLFVRCRLLAKHAASSDPTANQHAEHAENADKAKHVEKADKEEQAAGLVSPSPLPPPLPCSPTPRCALPSQPQTSSSSPSEAAQAEAASVLSPSSKAAQPLHTANTANPAKNTAGPVSASKDAAGASQPAKRWRRTSKPAQHQQQEAAAQTAASLWILPGEASGVYTATAPNRLQVLCVAERVAEMKQKDGYRTGIQFQLGKGRERHGSDAEGRTEAGQLAPSQFSHLHLQVWRAGSASAADGSQRPELVGELLLDADWLRAHNSAPSHWLCLNTTLSQQAFQSPLARESSAPAVQLAVSRINQLERFGDVGELASCDKLELLLNLALRAAFLQLHLAQQQPTEHTAQEPWRLPRKPDGLFAGSFTQNFNFSSTGSISFSESFSGLFSDLRRAFGWSNRALLLELTQAPLRSPESSASEDAASELRVFVSGQAQQSGGTVGRLLVQPLSREEYSNLETMLPHYASYCLLHPQTLLPRLLLCFALTGGDSARLGGADDTLRMVVMENPLFCATSAGVKARYDLKGKPRSLQSTFLKRTGSTEQLESLGEDCGLDQEFVTVQKCIALSGHGTEQTLQQLQLDTRFLLSQHCLHYSLSVAVHRAAAPAAASTDLVPPEGAAERAVGQALPPDTPDSNHTGQESAADPMSPYAFQGAKGEVFCLGIVKIFDRYNPKSKIQQAQRFAAASVNKAAWDPVAYQSRLMSFLCKVITHQSSPAHTPDFLFSTLPKARPRSSNDSSLFSVTASAPSLPSSSSQTLAAAPVSPFPVSSGVYDVEALRAAAAVALMSSAAKDPAAAAAGSRNSREDRLEHVVLQLLGCVAELSGQLALLAGDPAQTSPPPSPALPQQTQHPLPDLPSLSNAVPTLDKDHKLVDLQLQNELLQLENEQHWTEFERLSSENRQLKANLTELNFLVELQRKASSDAYQTIDFLMNLAGDDLSLESSPRSAG